MMSHPVNQLNSWSLWAQINPSRCPCHGSGWLLSDYDTWHACGMHPSRNHPECEEPEPEPGRDLEMYRKAYRAFLNRSGMNAAQFRKSCEARMNMADPSPADWVNAAEAVFEDGQGPDYTY